MARADFVNTGEGKVDASSLQGKVVGSVSKLCNVYSIRMIVIAGQSSLQLEELELLEIEKLLVISSLAENEEDGIKNARKYIEKLSSKLNL